MEVNNRQARTSHWFDNANAAQKAYILFRPSRDWVNADAEVEAICGWENLIQVLGTKADGALWDNGIIARCLHEPPFDGFLAELFPFLDLFENWIVHDGNSHFAEKYSDGPASTFFNSDTAGNERKKVTMICIYDADQDYKADETADLVRGTLGEPAVPTFHLKDGRVLMMRTAQTPKMICGRIASLRRRYLKVVVTSEQGSYSLAGDAGHMWNEPAETFYAPDEIE